MTSIDRRSLIAASLAGTLAPAAARAGLPGAIEPRAVIPLWPGAPAGLTNAALDDHIVERPGPLRDRYIDRIRTPQIHAFPAARPNGAAMLIAPGGGYERVVLDKEGYELAGWLSERGVSAFVLFYRLPAEGWTNGRDVPLADAQRAMRLIRARASGWQVDPKRVGAIGFSAGGHLCASLATGHARKVYAPVDAADSQDARPTVAAPIYPVVSMDPAIAHAGSRERLIGANAAPELEAAYSPDRNVTAATPPLFLVHAEDDKTVPVENALRLRTAAKAAGVPVDTHLFDKGGHGFGLRAIKDKPVEAWPDLLLGWMKAQGMLG